MSIVSDDYKTMNSEIDLKRKLIEATDAVRKKYNSIKKRHAGDKLTLEKVYEPITTPLKAMSSALTSSPSPPLKQATQNKLDALLIKKRKCSDSSVDSISGNYHSPSSEPSDVNICHGFDAAAAAAQEMHSNDDGYSLSIQKTSTPLPTTSIASPSISQTSGGSSDRKKIHYLAKLHIEGLKSGEFAYDSLFGIRIDPVTGKLLLGNAEVRFPGKNIAIWRGNTRLGTYRGSSDLYDLIFLRRPTSALHGTISQIDMDAYSDIIHKTNVIYKNNNDKLGLKTNRSKKYFKIIKPLVQSRKQSSSSTKMHTRSQYAGTGVRKMKLLPTTKVLHSNNINNGHMVDYVYWNKPKELVDRLRLLCSSKQAGHTGHDNEILSIIEELREEGIIY